MTDLTVVYFVAFASAFIWSSIKLWAIYAMGVPVYFNYVYKPKRLHAQSKSPSSDYTLYQIRLWIIEVVAGTGTFITLAMLLK